MALSIILSLAVILVGGFFLVRFYINHLWLAFLAFLLGNIVSYFYHDNWKERTGFGLFYTSIAMVLLAILSVDSGHNPDCFTPSRYCD